MVVLTSIFVAEINSAALLDRKPACDDMRFEVRKSALEQTGRELISMYEGKNRVEPME